MDQNRSRELNCWSRVFHPVSLQTDFLMVVLRDVVQAFPEVRVILMSATIDTSMFRQYFFDCPVIEVFGRTFPVQGTHLFRKQKPDSFCPEFPEMN